jgi:hypothetical protein
MAKKQLFKSRGTATVWDDQTISFMPQAEGKPVQDVLKQTRTSKLYATTSVNKPKIIAHLTAVKDSPSAVSDLYQQLDELTADMQDTAPNKKKTYRGGDLRQLLNEQGVTISLAKETLEVTMSIDLREHPDYNRTFYDQVTEISKCLAYNRDFMSQRLRVLASDSAK